MVGLGGGVFFVPTLLLAFGVTAQKAVGISLVTMTFSTFSAALAYARKGLINYRLGLLLDVLDVPGVLLGAYITTLLDPSWLASLFGILLFFVAFRLLRKGDSEADPQASGRRIIGLPAKAVYISLMASFLSGLVAGMFGAGGGTVDESFMVLAIGVPALTAAATSEFGMAVTNFAAALSHGFLGNILWEYAIPLTLGAAIGGQIGPHISGRVKEKTLRRILSAAFVLVGIRMLIFPYFH